MNEVFKINFKSDGTGIMESEEPINYNEVDFNLNQSEGRYGRDLDFSGGEVDFDFTEHRHSIIYDKLVQYYKQYGFEAEADLIIEKGAYNITGSIDFMSMEWKADNTFSCMVLTKNENMLIKTRSNIEVDLFSDKNIDGETITPAEQVNVLVKAKPLRQSSVWENTSGDIDVGAVSYDSGKVFYTYFNFSVFQTQSEIEDSLSFIPDQYFVSEFRGGGIELMRNFEIINSKTTLSNLRIKIEFNGSTYSHAPQGVSTNSQQLFLQYAVGVKPNNNDFNSWAALGFQKKSIINIVNQPAVTLPLEDFEISIGRIRTGESLFLAFQNLFSANDPLNYQTFNVNYKNIKITVYAESVSYDTTTPAVRLDNAVKQVVKSMNGTTVSFPMTEAGNLLRNTYLFSGNMMRGFQNKPFYVSFDDIKDWFKELNLDYEILADGTVFIDKYESFYPENEVMCIHNIQYDDYTETFNEDYAINKFSVKYEKYQSKKDTKIEGTIDNVHGEAEFSLVSKKADGEKAIEIPFARDPYLIEETKRNALKETTTTATNDDDTVFIIDCEPLDNFSRAREINANLLHEIVEPLVTLKLSNDGSFRFDLLGIMVNSTVTIEGVPGNNGTYNVITVNENDILLGAELANPTTSGQQYTTLKYSIRNSIVWQNKTLNPDIYEAENLFSPYSFSNIDFTIKSNIQRSWLRWLAAANLYNQNKAFNDIKLSKYINNKDLRITRKSDSVIVLDEGSDIDTSEVSPIVDTIIVNCTLIVTFEQFIEITNKMRSSLRGYLRIFDTNNEVLLIYPKELSLTYLDDYAFNLKVVGERKYTKGPINVSKNSLVTALNGVVVKTIDFGNSLTGLIEIKDNDDLTIYPKLNYQNISINGIFYTDYGAFKDALTL